MLKANEHLKDIYKLIAFCVGMFLQSYSVEFSLQRTALSRWNFEKYIVSYLQQFRATFGQSLADDLYFWR